MIAIIFDISSDLSYDAHVLLASSSNLKLQVNYKLSTALLQVNYSLITQVKTEVTKAAKTKLGEYGDPTKADVATKPIDVVQKGVSRCNTGPTNPSELNLDTHNFKIFKLKTWAINI